MRRLATSQLQRVLDAVGKLPLEDQEILLDLIRNRLVERRRAEIASEAKATLRTVHEGHAHYGSVDDLKRDLLSDA
jgi:hypothetical protein